MYNLILIGLLAIAVFIFLKGLKSKSKAIAIIGVLIGIISLGFFWFMGFWIDVLWFRALGFSNRFWIDIIYSSVFTLAGAIVSLLLVFGFIFSLPKNFKFFKWIALAVAAFVGGVWGYTNWETLLKFFQQPPTNIFDPIFGKSIGFYLFSLPFLGDIYGLLFISSFIGIATIFFALFVRITENGLVFYIPQNGVINTKKLFNILYITSGIFLLILAFGKLLSKYKLMYSSNSVVYGPGWTDANIVAPTYNIIVIIMILFSISFFIPSVRNYYQKFFKRTKMTYSTSPLYVLGGSAVAIILLWFLGLTIIPSAFQAFFVKPNEITYEKPYFANNIKFTRLGFGLDKVEEKEFPMNGSFTMQTVKNNPNIFNNIRLWDWRALDATYRQFQGFRLYYQFSSVDVDRYYINGEYREVMVATREMNIDNLPEVSQTFVNNRFQYTHGFGITMSTVNEFTPQGLPHLLIKDIPIKSEDSSLIIKQPRIYYGELTKTPVVVNSKEKEFDYPNGKDNVYTRYTGNGGVRFKGLWRKFLFSYKFDGTKLLFSGYPTDSSRIMYNRQIEERVRLLAPFLKFDKDPYIVLDNGKLYWIIDAYTSSSYFPYSEPFSSVEKIEFKEGNVQRELINIVDKDFNGVNYLRNSVKVTINAFDGSVNFYVMDENDPIIKVWERIYPNLFKQKSQMSKGLIAHIRYPKDMIRAQGIVYEKYHMTDPSVFYNQEDLWVRATEKYYSAIQPVEPYNIIWQLPDSDKPQFSLILPFTPKNRQVLIGWIAGLSDPGNYGRLIAYQFPKGEMITGTQQVETKIDQDSYLSGQLSLWDQRGSSVIRGNVLAIPVANTLFYVEPIYLQAETAAYPELRLVVVMHGDNMSYAKSFDKALEKLFASSPSKNKVENITMQTATGKLNNNSLAKQANDAFNNYLMYSGKKNFSAAAKELKKLQKALEQLNYKK
ncbi:MAG TPA: UPF0182 family protein [Ignavibacteria bacterium]|nr:UPF0182 family protein [Ignavibacteria bacterium]